MPIEDVNWMPTAEGIRRQQERRQQAIPYLLLHHQLKTAWLKAQLKELITQRQALKQELLEANRDLGRLPKDRWEHIGIIEAVKKEHDPIKAFRLLEKLLDEDTRAKRKRRRR